MSELASTLQTAVNLLARRDHSETELTQKLLARGFSRDHIQSTLATLIQKGWLNNARFVENYIRYRRTKGFGPLRIQAELIARGIPEELIEHQLNITDNTWLTEVRSVWQKRFKNSMPQDYKTRAQHMRFLYQRGFTTEQINSIFSDNNA